MKNEKEDRFEITELFMVKAGQKDWSRRFLGTIKKGVDESGKPFVCGRVQVNDCAIFSQADNEEELGERLDSMVLMILDSGMHSNAGKTSKISDIEFNLN